MNAISYIDDWRNLEDVEIIDVRSPAEFENDHIPGSINIPILSDIERHEVGLKYKQVNPFKAKIMGASLISKNISSVLEKEFSDKSGSWHPLIYCWRGGQRSRSLALVLNEIGWRVSVLQGGYKNFRKKVLYELDNVEQFNFKIIQGQTGSAKTKILSSLKSLKAQVLDLEHLACHRGSLLGRELDKNQPSQRYFETLLHDKIFEFDSNFPIYLESESSKIGNLHIPNKIWEKFSDSERILLEVPLNERVKFLLNEYDHLTKQKDLLKPFLKGMVGRYSNKIINYWEELILNNDWEKFVGEILENHYDPKYKFSENRYKDKIKFKIEIKKLDKLNVDKTSKKILNYINTCD